MNAISPRNIPLTKKAAVKSGFFVLDTHVRVEIVLGTAGAGVCHKGVAWFSALLAQISFEAV
ncbi:hypothetical protein KL86DES1_20481 [uncultured Desulfovibrio sp.]|uniref:Uncharacterized protein n=1 Tax=uncultured Desulfovibrio sp. TaxID=167968 RepID=A0A212L4G0_9BACT|nr:hypothetical protein KL86DES1_20481 [uncultured Desulfovibrio sp.]VZH33384.1 conserved protein of unknown function [Desulfovibrio sp. 86]